MSTFSAYGGAPPRSRRSRLLVSGALLAVLALSGMLMTSMAVFTDTSQVPGNAFSTGNVDISTDSDGSALFTTTNPMNPGDTEYEPLTVSNVGSMELRYAAESVLTAETSNTNSLQQQLDLTVYTGVSATDCSNGTVGGGSVLYGPGDLAGALNTPLPLFGDAAQGAQAGDRILAGTDPGPAGSEVLCFEVAMPLSTDETYGGHQVTVRFDFLAEQTVNNP